MGYRSLGWTFTLMDCSGSLGSKEITLFLQESFHPLQSKNGMQALLMNWNIGRWAFLCRFFDLPHRVMSFTPPLHYNTFEGAHTAYQPLRLPTCFKTRMRKLLNCGWMYCMLFRKCLTYHMPASSAFSAEPPGSAGMLRELVCLCLYVGQLSELAINFYCPTLGDTPSPYKHTNRRPHICIRWDSWTMHLYDVMDLIRALITDIYLSVQQ